MDGRGALLATDWNYHHTGRLDSRGTSNAPIPQVKASRCGHLDVLLILHGLCVLVVVDYRVLYGIRRCLSFGGLAVRGNRRYPARRLRHGHTRYLACLLGPHPRRCVYDRSPNSVVFIMYRCVGREEAKA